MFKRLKVGLALAAMLFICPLFAGDTLYLSEKAVIDSSPTFYYPGIKPMVSNDFDTGVIHFFYLRYENDTVDAVYQATSNDGFNTWSTPETASVYHHPSLTRYRAYYPTLDIYNGNIHMIYEHRGLPLYYSSWPDYPPSHIAYATNDGGTWSTSFDVINDSAIQTSDGNGSTVSYILRPFLLSKNDMEYCIAADNAWWATKYHVLFSKKAPGGVWSEGTALYTYDRGYIDKYTIPCASMMSDGNNIYAIWFNRYTGELMSKTMNDTTWSSESVIFTADSPGDGSTTHYYLIYPMSGYGSCRAVMSRSENYTLNELFVINKDSSGWTVDTAVISDTLITAFLDVCILDKLMLIFYSDNHVNSKLVTYSSIDGFSFPVTILTDSGYPVKWVKGVGNKIVWSYFNTPTSTYYLCAGNAPPIAVEENEKTNYKACLSRNIPNPFGSKTSIHYTVPRNEHVTINVYNIQGQLVKTLENGVKKAGNHLVNWDGRNNAGTKVKSGLYFYQLKTTRGVEATNKMMLLR